MISQKNVNILIVDDNLKNIQLAANVLKNTNLYSIYYATSGEKAIEQLKNRNYSLILLDINMPGLDGYETAHIIKNDKTTKHIPIIFLSANANKESIRKGFEYGGEDYITKPFDELELLHRVKTHVELFQAKQKLQNELDDTKILLEQYKNVVDVSALVSKTDENGNFTYVNDIFCKTSKYPRKDLLGKNCDIVKSPDMSDKVFDTIWQTIKNKQIYNGTLKNVAKDKTNYYTDVTIMPIVDANEDIIEYISVQKDITNEVLLQEDIVSTQKEVLQTLGELGESRSKETGKHVQRVALYSELLAKAYGCSDEEAQLLKFASPMHDIGKVVIPDSILLKPAKLTEEEFTEMKNHTTYGWEIFHKSTHKILQTAAVIAYEHHEKWDGTGYPRGLKGESINLFGRITAVADVFDALTQERVYKKAWSIEDTVNFLKEGSGSAFEPKLIQLFIENLEKILQIKNLYTENVS